MKIQVVKVKEHYEIHVDDVFYCSCDDLKEVEEELKEIKKKSVDIIVIKPYNSIVNKNNTLNTQEVKEMKIIQTTSVINEDGRTTVNVFQLVD